MAKRLKFSQTLADASGTMSDGPILRDSHVANSRVARDMAVTLCGAPYDASSGFPTALAAGSGTSPENSGTRRDPQENFVTIPVDMWSLRLELEQIGRRASALVHTFASHVKPPSYRHHGAHPRFGKTHLSKLAQGESSLCGADLELPAGGARWVTFLIALGCLVCGVTILGWGFVLQEPRLLYLGVPITATGSALCIAAWFLRSNARDLGRSRSGGSKQERLKRSSRRVNGKKLYQPAGGG